MYRKNTVGVVVTAYNEEGLVGKVIDTMPAFVDRVYAIDDCSTDRTWEEITHHLAASRADSVPLPDGGQNRRHRVVPIKHETNQGVGGAIKTGFRQALSDGVDLIVVMDGDGQMDPRQINRLLDPIVNGRAKYTKGSRFSTYSHCKRMSVLRFVGNSILTVLTKITSGYWHMRDPQNGYNAIAATALEQLTLSELYDGYGFRNDILVQLNINETAIVDVDMPAVYGDEDSAIRYREFIPRLSGLLLHRYFWRLREKYLFQWISPDEVLYTVGAVRRYITVIILGWIIILLHMIFREQAPPSWIAIPGLLLSGLLLVLSGLLAMLDRTIDRHTNGSTMTGKDNE